MLSWLAIALAVTPQQLTVDEAVARALQAHPAVEGARAEVGMARAAGAQAVAPFRPSISLNAYASDGTGAPIYPSMVMPQNWLKVDEQTFGTQNTMLMLPLYTGGRDRAAREMSAALVSGADARLATTEADIRLGVRAAYAETLRKAAYVDAYRAEVEADEELLRITREQFDVGKVPVAFLYRAEAELARAQGMLRMAEAERVAALAALKEAIGLGQSEEVTLTDWETPPAPAAGREEATEIALEARPELAAAQSEVDKASAQERAAKGSLAPDLTLMAMHDFRNSEMMGGSNHYSAALVASFPLLDGGLRRAGVEEARASKAARGAALDGTKLRVQMDVAQAWAEWEASAEVVAAAESSVRSYEEAYRVAVVRYEAGKAIQVEVTELLAELTQARARLADARSSRLIAWSMLMRAMGR